MEFVQEIYFGRNNKHKDNLFTKGMIMSPTELKMQPTIHLQSKPGYHRAGI
jgi:hypothetical protein